MPGTLAIPGADATAGRHSKRQRMTMFERLTNDGPRLAGTIRSLAAVLLIAAGLLAGCAGSEEEENRLLQDVQDAYETAQKSMLNGNYQRAIQIYEALQARFPFSDLSKQIQLNLMYSYYKSNRPEQAIDMADQFMRENPTHERVDYALYIKALSYFEKDPGFLERWFNKDVENRPPRDGQLAFSLLKRLVERYPASPYAEDAHQQRASGGETDQRVDQPDEDEIAALGEHVGDDARDDEEEQRRELEGGAEYCAASSFGGVFG